MNDKNFMVNHVRNSVPERAICPNDLREYRLMEAHESLNDPNSRSVTFEPDMDGLAKLIEWSSIGAAKRSKQDRPHDETVGDALQYGASRSVAFYTLADGTTTNDASHA